jgi:hypothetical protein
MQAPGNPCHPLTLQHQADRLLLTILLAVSLTLLYKGSST